MAKIGTASRASYNFAVLQNGLPRRLALEVVFAGGGPNPTTNDTPSTANAITYDPVMPVSYNYGRAGYFVERVDSATERLVADGSVGTANIREMVIDLISNEITSVSF